MIYSTYLTILYRSETWAAFGREGCLGGQKKKMRRVKLMIRRERDWGKKQQQPCHCGIELVVG
jgi:hypothetical protein